MTSAFLTFRCFFAASVLALSTMASAGPAEDAQAAFIKFFPGFSAYNQDRLAAMFAPEAQFYGTLSPQLVTTPQGVQAYFTAALNRPDVTVATPLQLTARALTDDVVLIGGTWKLERTLNGATVQGGPFRVTAVMHKRNDAWIVAQFHNSPVPAAPAPQPAASSR